MFLLTCYLDLDLESLAFYVEFRIYWGVFFQSCRVIIDHSTAEERKRKGVSWRVYDIAGGKDRWDSSRFFSPKRRFQGGFGAHGR